MKNLIFVFAILFTVFTSCADDDGLAVLVQEQEMEQVDDTNNTDDDDQDDQDNNDNDDNDDNNGNDDDDGGGNGGDDNNIDEECFLIKTSLEGNGFDTGTAYERNAEGRITEILRIRNGETILEASANYRPDGTLRALVIVSGEKKTNYHFDEDGLPLDGNSTLSDGTVNTIHLTLDSQNRIIKRIIREGGKDIAEFNFLYSGDILKSQEGYVIRTLSSGNEVTIDLHRFYKYDEKSANPFALDPYVAQLALGKNISAHMVTEMSTGTGVQFEASYELDSNSFPTFGKYFSPADGDMTENFTSDCF